MKHARWMIIIVVIMFVLAGCGSNKKEKVAKPTGTKTYFPTWWDTQNDPDNVCAYGLAEKASLNMSIQSAKMQAMQDIGRYVETIFRGMVEDYQAEIGMIDPQNLASIESALRATVNTEFSGVLTGATETMEENTPNGKRYTTYIQLKIPRDQVNKSLVFNIRNEEALYNQFKASQAFDKLDSMFD